MTAFEIGGVRVQVSGAGALHTTPINLTVKELDGSPSVVGVTTIKFPNGTLTDNGDGSVTYTPAGGGGGGTPTAITGAGGTLDAADATGILGVAASGKAITLRGANGESMRAESLSGSDVSASWDVSGLGILGRLATGLGLSVAAVGESPAWSLDVGAGLSYSPAGGGVVKLGPGDSTGATFQMGGGYDVALWPAGQLAVLALNADGSAYLAGGDSASVAFTADGDLTLTPKVGRSLVAANLPTSNPGVGRKIWVDDVTGLVHCTAVS